MNPEYLLTIPFKTDKYSGILIKEDDNVEFNIGENHIKLNYNKTTREGSFEVINSNRNSLIDFYNNLKNVVNTMSLYSTQYTNWNMKLEKFDGIDGKIIELKPSEITKNGNQWEITTHLDLKIDVGLAEAIASMTVSSLISDIQSIYEKIGENCQIENKTTILDLYKNSFFQEKTSRFLSYVNILELLTTNEHISKNQQDCLDDLIEIVDTEYKDKLTQDEISSLKSRIGHLKRKSITKKVQSLPEKHGVYIKNFEYSKEMLKTSYDVRSDFAHEGEVNDDFDVCYDFLEKFIPKLLRKILKINEMD